MADVDAELEERVTRWCAEAGRQTDPAQIRRALAPLGWDDLLALRALLADPPPARPLGPFALADIARGAPPELAAERERAGRYEPLADGDAPPPPAPLPARPRGTVRGRAKTPPIVIRRARDRTAPTPPAAVEPPLLDELRRPEGRSVLEQLVRTRGARRAALARALAAGWRRLDGRAAGEEDVAALLEHHDLARAFARRERDELLHALRAAGGFRPAAAERLGLDSAGLEAALVRLGLTDECERIRAARRTEFRRRGTLAERLRLVLTDEERMRDLGLLEELEADLRARLPEHVRALRLGDGPLDVAFAASLGLDRRTATVVAARFGVEIATPRSPAGTGAAGPAARVPRPSRGRAAPARGAGSRRGGARAGSSGSRRRPGSPGSRKPPPRRGGR